MLVIFLLLGLHTKLVDYAAAFVHANIDRDPNWGWMSEFEHQQSGIYIQMLKGFQTPGHILKLKKSLNGLKQSPKGQACQPCTSLGLDLVGVIVLDDLFYLLQDTRPQPHMDVGIMKSSSTSLVEVQ
jgi:hypothetical protein